MSRDIFWIGFLVLAMIVLFMVLPSQAADYYVSTAGSDNGPGTQAQPFATIQHAIDACPYDVNSSTVHLDASTWNESPVLIASNYYSYPYYPPVQDRPFLAVIGDYTGPNGIGGLDRTIINGCFTVKAEQDPPIYTNSACASLGGVTVTQVNATATIIGAGYGQGTPIVNITNCHVIGSPTHGITTNSYTMLNAIFIKDCIIENNLGDGIYTVQHMLCPIVTNSIIRMNGGNGLTLNVTYYVDRSIFNNIISKNNGYGLCFELDETSGSYTFKVYNNTITKNGSFGVLVKGSGCSPDLGGGILSSPGNNTIMGNGEYDIYFPNGTTNLYAKYNHWDEATEAQMESGNQKKTNITRFYDIFDYWQPSMTPTGAVIWDSNFGRNDKLDPSKTSISLSNNSKVQPTSLGSIKAAYR